MPLSDVAPVTVSAEPTLASAVTFKSSETASPAVKVVIRPTGERIAVPASTVPSTSRVEPSNVKFASSSRAPDVPAITTRLLVRSLMVAEERVVSPPETSRPPFRSVAPVTVKAEPTLASTVIFASPAVKLVIIPVTAFRV